MIDDLKAMAIFAEVAKLGSFRAAAKSLNLSPSVVSYHVTQLEQQLGTALLYRSTRKLSLSHEGKILAQHIGAMILSAQQGLEQISRQTAELAGQLTITLPSALIKSPITSKLAQFATAHPKVSLNLRFTDQREDLIANGIDLALSAGKLENSNLKAKSIGEIKRTLVCQPQLYHQLPTPEHPSDLASWPWIKLDMLPNQRTFQRTNYNDITVTFNHQVTVNHVEAMVQLSLLGTGLATPAHFQVESLLENGNLLEVLPDWKIAPIPLYAVWPSNIAEKSLVKSLLAHLIT